MKPSKLTKVVGKKAKFLLPRFSAITWKGCVYCKRQEDADEINKTPEIDSQLESHETIHIRQAESAHDSWFRFYVRYVWDWIKNLPLIFVNLYAPYKFEAMELEAYLHQDEWDYCTHGAVSEWKEFEKIPMKEKRAWAKEYYGSKPKPYFTHFLQEKLKRTRG